MSIFDKKVVFIMSFGHCGIDWLQSLFNSHPTILMMPTISFYRVWSNLKCDNITNPIEMTNTWKFFFTESLYDHRGCKTSLIEDNEKMKNFYDRFFHNLKSCEISKKNVFFMLHDAYAYANNIDLSNISHIVTQEHDPFSFECLHLDFKNPTVLFIVRDPRSAFAGAYKGIERKCNKNVNCWDSMTRLFHAEWVYSMKLRKKYINSDKKSFYIVKNEDLSTDINNEMMSISEYIGIEYNDILLESTSFTKNVEWVVDSCYISRNDNNVESDYFSKDRVKKRWISVLSYKDILMIESVCSVIIKSYNYDRISPDNIVSFYLGYLYFLFPIRGVNRSALYRVKSVEKNNLILSIKNPIARNIYSIMPLFLFTFFINIGIVLKRIYILFFDITNKYKS